MPSNIYVNNLFYNLEKQYSSTTTIEAKYILLDAKNYFLPLRKYPNLFNEDSIETKLQWIKSDLKREAEKRHNKSMKKGLFLRIPKEYEFVNEDEAQNCDGAAVIVVFNGEKFGIPPYVYFYRNSHKDEHLHEYIEQMMLSKYPNFKRALEIEHLQKGRDFTAEEFKDNKVMHGVFYMEEADEYLKYLDLCFEYENLPLRPMPCDYIAIYRGGEPDAAANSKN